MSKSNFEDFKDFNRACEKPEGNLLGFDTKLIPVVNMNLDLIHEEYAAELLPHMTKYLEEPSFENLVAVADDIVDTVYVLMQLAVTLGVPFDQVWDEVHRSNMAKAIDGKVLRRHDGKILKPEGWKPPNVWEVMKQVQDEQCRQMKLFGAENWNATNGEKYIKGMLK